MKSLWFLGAFVSIAMPLRSWAEDYFRAPQILQSWTRSDEAERHTPGPFSFTMDDLDLNGHDDVILLWPDGFLTAIPQNGPGQFGDPRAVMYIRSEGNTEVRRPVFADLDGDGLKDGVAVSGASGRIWWAKNQGDGGVFYPIVDVGVNVSSEVWSETYADDVAAGDVDMDGDIDLVGVFTYPSSVRLYRNNGDAQFTEEVLFESSDLQIDPVIDVSLVDLTGDGYPEIDLVGLAVPSSFAVEWQRRVYLNFSGSFGTPLAWDNGYWITPGPLKNRPGIYSDIDNDGLTEIVAIEPERISGFVSVVTYDWDNGQLNRAEIPGYAPFRKIHEVPDRTGSLLPALLGLPEIRSNSLIPPETIYRIDLEGGGSTKRPTLGPSCHSHPETILCFRISTRMGVSICCR